MNTESAGTTVDWRTDRLALFAYFWNEGYAGREIARRIGGFENCRNGGHNAVCGIAHRHRKNAVSSSEKKFWSRGSRTNPIATGRSRAASNSNDVSGKSSDNTHKQRRNSGAVLTLAQKLQIVDDSPMVTVRPPTDAQVLTESAAAIAKGSWEPERDWSFPAQGTKRTDEPVRKPKCSHPMQGMLFCGSPAEPGTARCKQHGGQQIAQVLAKSPPKDPEAQQVAE